MTTTNNQSIKRTNRQSKVIFFVFVFIPLLVLISGFGWYVFRQKIEEGIRSIENRETARATMVRELIEHGLESVSNDVLILATHAETVGSLKGNTTFDRQELADEYLVFCKTKDIFDQAFLIDSTGQEIVRIVKHDGDFSIVPPESLRYTGDDEHLRETMRLDQGKVSYASFYSDIEDSVVERKRYPVIRVSAPVQSRDGLNIGAVVLDFSAAHIMEHYPIAVAQSMDQAMLVTREGYCLFGEWKRCAYKTDTRLQDVSRFQDAFPEVWSKIGRSGEGHYRTDRGLFTFAVIGSSESNTAATFSVIPTQADISQLSRSSLLPEWTLISRVTPEYFAEAAARKARTVLIVSGGIAVFLGVMCWYIIGARTQRRRTHDVIRRISERVSALTGESFFRSLVEELCEILNVEYAIVGEMVGTDNKTIRSLAFYANGEISANIEYDLANTPCESVMNADFCIYPSGVQKLFPKDDDLVQMEVESYIGVPLRDSSGKPLGILAALGKRKLRGDEFGKHEFSILAARASAELERIRSVKALQRSEYILRESQKAAQIGSYTCDLLSGNWESSEILNAIFGIDSDYEKSVSGWLQIVHPEDREEVREYFLEDVMANQNAFDREYRIVRQSDKAVRWVHGMGILEFDEAGRPIELIGTSKDITERKEAEHALRKSEHRYEELFSSLLEGVCMVDASDNITFCNPAFSKLLEEESPEHVIGKSILDYIVPGQKEIVLAQTAIRKTNLCSKYEVEMITAKKHRRTFQLSASPRFSESGEYCGASANIFDTTEVKRLRELESRAQRLETAGQIAGQVAHDFNNLLAPLMAYPELIREELSDDHPAQEYLKAMEKSAAQIAEINEQLLTLGRRGHYNLVPMDLNEVVRQGVEDSKQTHGSIEYQISFAEEISKFMGGPAQIHRVILNLLENACDSMNDTGVITIMTENDCLAENCLSTGGSIPAGEYVKLTVSDAGEGIEEALLPKIFDPFFSSKKTDRRRGSGLGLSVVHSVVRDHGGYMDISTRVGKGTSFYLYFPVTGKCAKIAGNAEYDGGNESILIVDDDPLQQDVSGKLLTKLGYRITLAESGEQAIELMSNNSYDLLILDMIMPSGIDGTETYRRALAVNPGQKGLIVSGFSESVRVTEAKSLGAGAFVKKPLTRQSIARAVRTELNRELQSTVS